jgi:hypothetical protein
MKSDTGQLKVGRPDAALDGGFIFEQYCGGKGGGGCLDPLGVTGIAIPYKMPRSIVRHRRILLENKEFNGVRIYTDAGSNGLCAHSLGSEVGFYLALSVDGNLSAAQMQQQGKFISGVLPYDIEFLAKDIPQPKDPSYDGYIYLQYYWGNAGYINEGGAIDQYSMRIKKHDYDIEL